MKTDNNAKFFLISSLLQNLYGARVGCYTRVIVLPVAEGFEKRWILHMYVARGMENTSPLETEETLQKLNEYT